MVDVDEADVAVLNQNLVKSKELFNSISRSLHTISNKTNNASVKVKPILSDVNKLTREQENIDQGIAKLNEVSAYAERTNTYEAILSSSIESVGIGKFLDTLTKLKSLLKEMKTKIKSFYGILINFENLIDKLEFKLSSYFKKLVESGQSNEILLISKYFNGTNKQIQKTLVDSRSKKLIENMTKIQSNNQFKPKAVGPKSPPYEKGTNGINEYCRALLSYLNKEYDLLEKLGSQSAFSMVIDHSMDNFNEVLEKNYLFVFNESNLIGNDLLILEIVEVLEDFSNQFSRFDDIKNYKVHITFTKLYGAFKQIFKEYLKFIEHRIQSVEKIFELSTEIVVELVTRIRKISEYPVGLNRLIESYNIGEWLNVKPLKFISVYTSVIKGDTEQPQLLSNFMSDLIDCIMINIEIRFKEYKKSTQGFYLIKNVILIETIINRSNNLFNILGSIGMERLNKLKNRFLKLFLDDWNYASYIIIRDMTLLTALSATNLSNDLSTKEKDQIKKLFDTFNEAFEDAIKNYQKFNILDPDLRHYLVSEIKKLIINAYFKLYDKYANSGFTKNKPKYVKYNKLEFENILNDRLG